METEADGLRMDLRKWLGALATYTLVFCNVCILYVALTDTHTQWRTFQHNSKYMQNIFA